MATTSSGRSAGEIEREAVEQFTVHARSFAQAAVINDERALAVLGDLADLGPSDRVVDVACGPGIVTCRLAATGAAVTGVDLTPTMLSLAAERAASNGVGDRTTFVRGRMDRLPFPDGSFDVVVNRYALHHAADPDLVAAELIRVTAPGGRLVIVDFAATTDTAAAAAYDDAERGRDPSHVRNLTVAEQERLFAGRGCRLADTVAYRVEARLGPVLANSHGPDHDGVRRAFEAATATHGLGVDAHWDDGDIAFVYPIVAHCFTR